MGKRREHDLKIEPKYFNAICYENKRFEIRKNDRNYKVFDYLILREFDNGVYTGRLIYCRINYITPMGCIGIKKNYVVMNILVLSAI